MAPLKIIDQGSGPAVILLHGFPFHSEIWNRLIGHMGSGVRVIAMDLPGFGGSTLPQKPFTLETVANEIITCLRSVKVASATLVGHSLGGYVALAAAEKAPELFSGLILLHSTAYADNTEKKLSRDKVVDFIKNNGVKAFTGNFIPPLFADKDHPEIRHVQQIAQAASEEAVTGYTIAMRDRKEKTSLLRNFHKPVLFITGEKDAGIPVESVKEQAKIPTRGEFRILHDVGHMGMYEDPGRVADLIKNFIAESNRP